MPTYEYTCKNCDHTTQKMRTISERDNPVVCTECAQFMVRSINAAPVHFKGTGFYKTGG